MVLGEAALAALKVSRKRKNRLTTETKSRRGTCMGNKRIRDLSLAPSALLIWLQKRCCWGRRLFCVCVRLPKSTSLSQNRRPLGTLSQPKHIRDVLTDMTFLSIWRNSIYSVQPEKKGTALLSTVRFLHAPRAGCQVSRDALKRKRPRSRTVGSLRQRAKHHSRSHARHPAMIMRYCFASILDKVISLI